MSCKELYGALDQFWSIEEKPRLHRRNTYFRDKQLSNYDALRIGIIFSTVATAILIFWLLMGLMI